MKLWVNILVLSGMTMILSGCLGESAPECDSKEAKNLVINILTKDRNLMSNPLGYGVHVILANVVVQKEGSEISEEQLNIGIEREIKTLTLENILTESTNKELKKSICSADIALGGKTGYFKRVKYRQSVTSDGKLYTEVSF